ncbi:hypothetical protein FAY30_24800 [Bacillus sp. S3]|nr:hypothetical protein FAY30_24800 [Bacillus sp. S3]
MSEFTVSMGAFQCLMSGFCHSVSESKKDTANNNLSIMRDIFTKEKFPIPIGFTEENVNPRVKRTYRRQ